MIGPLGILHDSRYRTSAVLNQSDLSPHSQSDFILQIGKAAAVDTQYFHMIRADIFYGDVNPVGNDIENGKVAGILKRSDKLVTLVPADPFAVFI